MQTTIYALALARRTRLPLKMFKCAWFDEKDYFEFYPLAGVYKTRSHPPATRTSPHVDAASQRGKVEVICR